MEARTASLIVLVVMTMNLVEPLMAGLYQPPGFDHRFIYLQPLPRLENPISEQLILGEPAPGGECTKDSPVHKIVLENLSNSVNRYYGGRLLFADVTVAELLEQNHLKSKEDCNPAAFRERAKLYLKTKPKKRAPVFGGNSVYDASKYLGYTLATAVARFKELLGTD